MSTTKCIDTISVSPAQFPLTWRGWLRAGAVLGARLMAAPFDVLWMWQMRIRDRRALREFDAHLRTDLSAPEEDLKRLAYRPFWLP